MTVKHNIPKRGAFCNYYSLDRVIITLSVKYKSLIQYIACRKSGIITLPLMLTVANKNKLLEPCWGNKLRHLPLEGMLDGVRRVNNDTPIEGFYRCPDLYILGHLDLLFPRGGCVFLFTTNLT